MGSEKIADVIDRQEWLDSIEGVQSGVRDLLGSSEAVKNALHGVWLGHPLHPVLTDLPVGAWTVALAADAAELITGSKDAGSAADAAIGVGLLGAVGAAVTGLADWSETDYRARKIGAVHGALNVVATSLYTASFVKRASGGNRRAAIGLSMLGYAIAGLSAYLGGHLVFGEQVGVDHTATADDKQPEKFTAVIEASKLREGVPQRVEADGVAICLLRRGESIFAITETCPHMGGPLSEGKLEGDVIQCPWHGSKFDVSTGAVERGPSAFPARCFEVRVRSGKVEVRAASKQGITNVSS